MRGETVAMNISPKIRELSFILNHSNIDVLVLNGNSDYIVNTPSQINLYEKLA